MIDSVRIGHGVKQIVHNHQAIPAAGEFPKEELSHFRTHLWGQRTWGCIWGCWEPEPNGAGLELRLQRESDSICFP